MLLAALGLVACSESDEPRPSEGTGGQKGTGGQEGGSNTEDALYALGAGICGPDSCQTYLLTTPSLESGKLDVRGNGRELQGFINARSYDGALFVPGGEAPTLTRYTVDEAGKLVPGRTLSFAGAGLSASFNGNRIAFISADKAYLFDEATLKALVWNPSEMALTGKEIDISAIQLSGQDAFVSADESGAQRRGDRLFVPVGWSDSSTYDARPVAGMLILDTARDEVVDFFEDDRCTALESTVVAESGDIYYFTSAAMILSASAVNPDFPSCALRIKADETKFDPDYFLNLSEATGGRIAAWGVPGPSNEAYVQVLYEERSGISDRAELFGSAHNDWRFWRIDLATKKGTEITDFPWFATSGPPAFRIGDGQVHQSVLTLSGESGGLFSNVERSTTLVDLSGAKPVPTLSVDGNILFFSRVR